MKRLGNTVMVLALVGGAGWFALIGHHRHALEITRSPGATPDIAAEALQYRLRSNRSPFTVTTPGQSLPTPSFTAGFSEEYHWSSAFQARRQSGIGMVHSRQVVNVPQATTAVAFIVNGIPFTLLPDQLRGAGKTWPRPAEGHVDIFVDGLEAPR